MYVAECNEVYQDLMYGLFTGYRWVSKRAYHLAELTSQASKLVIIHVCHYFLDWPSKSFNSWIYVHALVGSGCIILMDS